MRPSTGQASLGGLPPEAAEVRGLLAKGNTKSAVEAAKQLHKNVGTPASEALLVDAYLARAVSMVEHHMAAEADALIAMVRQRYPASAPRLNTQWGSLAATSTALEELLRPLADPSATTEARSTAERTVRTKVVDLAALAQCPALPADHPLRQGAAALHRAFEAVTSGPVNDADAGALALPSISRRSPLAPWKPLIRAIACFYRRDDAACLEHLRAVDPESAAARLVPALQTMLAGQHGHKLKPAAAALARRVGGNLEDLRESLAALDREFQNPSRKRALNLIRDAVAVAQQECPEILADLRQWIAVRAMVVDLPVGSTVSAMGAAPKNDARFRLQVARAMEMDDDLLLPTCHLWEEFRVSAIHEGWFPSRGPETATVYLHMAELAAHIDPDQLAAEYERGRDVLRQVSPGVFQPAEPEMPYLHPEWLYEQACAMDPDPITFQRWAGWAERHDQPQAAEKAAMAWRHALPADPRPLLCLMRYAEDRDALKKALGYLRQAEALDGVSAEVRRARLRLLVLGAIRHLKQRKPRLAEPELLELEALPQARENDRPAFVAALRAISAFLAGEQDRFIAAGLEIHRMMGSKLAGALALAAVGTLCGQPLGVSLDQTLGSPLEAVSRVWAMGQDFGFAFGMPMEWKPAVLQDLKGRPSADAGVLEQVGQMALSQHWRDLAYAVSAAGLALGNADACFLFLRARSLPAIQFSRIEECLMAAIALAQRRNEMALANQALEYWRNKTMAGSIGMELEDIAERELQSVLHRERHAPKLDDDFRLPFDRGPRRRRRRGPWPQNQELPF